MTALEDRLTAALDARAEQVQMEHLVPSSPPEVATVPPLRCRLLPAAALVAVAACAAVATAVVGHGDGSSTPSDPAGFATEGPTPPTPDPTGPPDLPAGRVRLKLALDEDDTRFAPVGRTTHYDDGTAVSLRRDGARTQIVLTGDGAPAVGDVEVPAGSAPELATTEVHLGRAGTGYVVRAQVAEEVEPWTLYVHVGDALVAATPTGSLPLGRGFTTAGTAYYTYIPATGDGLVTRTQEDMNRPGAYEFVTYDATGPGTTLVPHPLGTVCADYEHGSSYRRC